MRTLIISVVLTASLIGCSKGKKNVEACEDYVAALSCGDFDVTTLYDDSFCDAYSETTCDIADYFTCLEDSVTCDEDTSALTVDAAGCASKATCD